LFGDCHIAPRYRDNVTVGAPMKSRFPISTPHWRMMLKSRGSGEVDDRQAATKRPHQSSSCSFSVHLCCRSLAQMLYHLNPKRIVGPVISDGEAKLQQFAMDPRGSLGDKRSNQGQDHAHRVGSCADSAEPRESVRM
jgi:hypothetical protein